MFPAEIKKRLRLISKRNLHSKEEIRWGLWKSGCNDQWPYVKAILVRNFYATDSIHDPDEISTAIRDFPYHHAALALRRDPFSGIRKLLGFFSRQRFDVLFQRALRYMVREFLRISPDAGNASSDAKSFKILVGAEVFGLH
jgi:hypothetical protein